MSFALINKYLNHSPVIGCYGQRPRSLDFPAALVPFKSFREETTLEKCIRYAWTAFPLLSLIKPLGPALTYATEMARTAQSMTELMSSRDRKTTCYQAFRVCLSVGAIATLDHSLPPLLRRIFLGIKLLGMGHEVVSAALRFDRSPGDINEYQIFKLGLLTASNISGMAAIIFQTPLATFWFLGVQTIAALFHAGRNFEKDKYFPGGIHLLIALIRLHQSGCLLIDHLFDSPQERFAKYEAELERLKAERLKNLIAPSETMKENLSPYEAEIAKFLGKEFLYFKTTGLPKFLILSAGPEADYNKAFSPLGRTTLLINKLSERFDVKYRTITSVEDLKRELRDAAQMGPVRGLMIQAHGEPKSLLLGNDPNSGRLSSKDISSDLFAGLARECDIVLDACSTAATPWSLAYRVANLSQRTTFAADRVAYGAQLKQTDPLEWSFEREGKNVQTKRITPLEDDSLLTFLKSLFN